MDIKELQILKLEPSDRLVVKFHDRLMDPDEANRLRARIMAATGLRDEDIIILDESVDLSILRKPENA